MKPLLSAKEMKQIDTDTIETSGISSLELMERAACAVEAEIIKYISYEEGILVLCGMGNNGADGLALARMLTVRGYRVQVITVGNRERATEEWREQYRHILPEQEYHIETAGNVQGMLLLEMLSEAQVLVDAIFGIGLTRELIGVQAWLVEQVNMALEQEKKTVFAVDMPSGIHTDTGKVMGCAIPADVTVTFGYVKRGQFFYPGTAYCGNRIVADIGFMSEADWSIEPECYAFERADLKCLPERNPDSHKGTYGKLLVVAGQKGMAGAALFCATAAYRSGCGLVNLATDQENRVIAQSVLPEAVYMSLQDVSDWTAETLKQQRFSAAVIGPGLGTGPQAKAVLEKLLSVLAVPIVLDADALNLVSIYPDMAEVVRQYAYPVILTPHMGELSRLLSCGISSIKEDLVRAARQAAERFSCVCVAKDTRTVVAAQTGNIYINTSGNDGMATGGSGDVLSGIIGGLLAQRMDAPSAAAAGVFLHGLAGDEAAKRLGRASVMARDILDGISAVLKEIQ